MRSGTLRTAETRGAVCLSSAGLSLQGLDSLSGMWYLLGALTTVSPGLSLLLLDDDGAGTCEAPGESLFYALRDDE
jgi:hypothetical protein